MVRFIFAFLIAISLPLFGEAPSDVKQLMLKNGMKVWFKKTHFEPGEVNVRLVAEGGFALLPEDQRGSGELAAQVAIESGFGGMSYDQLSALQYENSIEFQVRVLPFSRDIEANARKESLPVLLNLIKKYFTERNLTKEAFDSVVKQYRESLKMRVEDYKQQFEDAFKVLNTQNYHFLKPFKTKYIDNATLEDMKNFMDFAFADPSNFAVVIVGDFDFEKTVANLESTLGTIPRNKPKLTLIKPPLPIFPSGVTTKVISYPGRSDSLARLTFPLTERMEEKFQHAFNVGLQILEIRLREALTKQLQSSQSVNVTYELPLYPMLAYPWVVIQYRSVPKRVGQAQEIILKTLHQLKEQGPTQQELKLVESIVTRNEDYWLKDNDFWIAALTNSVIWGWDPSSITFHGIAENDLTVEKVKSVFKSYLKTDQYTWIHSNP